MLATTSGSPRITRRAWHGRAAEVEQPLGSDGSGTAFIYRDGIESAMEAEASARHLTLALAGRAKNVAPALADAVPMDQFAAAAGRRWRNGHLQLRACCKRTQA